jgi:hypothetical protein
MKNIFWVFVILLAFASCTQPVTTFVEAEDPVALTVEQAAMWDEVG